LIAVKLDALLGQNQALLQQTIGLLLKVRIDLPDEIRRKECDKKPAHQEKSKRYFER
jgi:hypothetical protein